jgi:spermidine/putrescine transport system permease protein
VDSWRDPCGPRGLCESVVRSVEIGFVATLTATVLGTLMAFALVRHRFRGRSGTNLLIFLPMATPEVVMGSSLLALFTASQVPLGFWTVVIAHVMFCISFVVVTVKARLTGLDSRLEEAAMDLYANEWQTFRRITLPLVLPGIVAAALLAFSLSFDDFIITNFNAGPSTITFPMYVWGAAQRGIPPEVNVVGTAMFAVSFLLVVATMVRRRRPVGR